MTKTEYQRIRRAWRAGLRADANERSALLAAAGRSGRSLRSTSEYAYAAIYGLSERHAAAVTSRPLRIVGRLPLDKHRRAHAFAVGALTRGYGAGMLIEKRIALRKAIAANGAYAGLAQQRGAVLENIEGGLSAGSSILVSAVAACDVFLAQIASNAAARDAARVSA